MIEISSSLEEVMKGNVLVILSKDSLSLDLFGRLDERVNGHISKMLKDFPDVFNKNLLLDSYILDENVKSIHVIGLKDLNFETVRREAVKALKSLSRIGINNVKIIPLVGQEFHAETFRALIEAHYYANYNFDKYKTVKNDNKEISTTIYVDENVVNEAEKILTYLNMVFEGVNMARDLINEPASIRNPQTFAEFTEMIFAESNVQVEILDYEELVEKGFEGIIAVGKGSKVKPKFVILKYMQGSNKPIVLVGKGVTFDSGGLDLKTREGITYMKIDMAGAAAVLATIYNIEKLQLKVNLVGLIPLVENMPSGEATKPGDVIHIYKGKTVEILNTDAEGRLILADAISYAANELDPEYIIDIATLTGACAIALGNKIAGLMTNSPELKNIIMEASKETKEKLWELPLEEEYNEMLKSYIADIKNIGDGPFAGAIIGGLFLKHFTKNKKWAHLDIAGVTYITKKDPIYGTGATGYGVKLLTQLINNISKR
ncbi:MAG: leucyl aminopeptidase [Candidatus Njordarchaeia archaeon]